MGTTCGTSAEIRTEYEYWGDTALPSLERRVDAAGGQSLETRYSYDPAGRLVSVDGPRPGTDDATHNRYDVHGRRTWEIGALAPDGLRIATRYVYRESDDRVLSSETGTLPNLSSTMLTVFRRTDLTYDSRRNPVREAVSSSGTTHTVLDKAYDALGRLECTAVRMNPAAFGQMPGACAPTTQSPTHGPDRIARNFYDAAGQRLQLREGAGTPDEAAEATWAYNLNGQVTQVIDGNGNRAELRYDGHGRQGCWTFPSATRPPSYNDATQATALASAGSVNADDYEEYGYDAAGNRTSLRTRDGSVLGYDYDALGRMTRKTVPERPGLDPVHTRDVYYGYDLRNLQTFARFDGPAGEGVTNAYDGFGRLASSSIDMGGTTRILVHAYDAAGNRTWAAHPDGVWFAYNHDALGRPFFLMAQSGPGILYTAHADHGAPAWSYRGDDSFAILGYDGVQRLAALSHYVTGSPANVATTYAYNPAGQLASVARDNDDYAWTGHYTVARPYTANGLNQYITAGSASFTYDNNGNLTGDGSRSFAYDVENRLISASPPSTGSGQGEVALTYDPLGRLFQVAVGGTATTTFLYDGDALVAEYDGAGAMTQRYPHWVGADVPLVSYAGASLSNPIQLFADHQGSIVPRRPHPAWRPRSTATTNTASPRRPTRAGSNIPARSGSPSSACTTTRRGSTRRLWGGSCRPIRSGMTTSSTSMRTWERSGQRDGPGWEM